MPHDKYVKIGFSEQDFDSLDRKRFEARTTFQALGSRFFKDWLSETQEKAEATPDRSAMTPEEEKAVQKLLSVLRYGREEYVSAALGGVESIFRLLELHGVEAGSTRADTPSIPGQTVGGTEVTEEPYRRSGKRTRKRTRVSAKRSAE